MKEIKIHEVGLRDGLQMESEPVPTVTKEQWSEMLIDSGLDILQLGSFVNPAKVPQMADTDELFEYFKNSKKNRKTLLSCLVLNEKGLERAVNADADMICMGVSASETHSKKNTGMTTDEALERIIKMAIESTNLGKMVQVSVQSAFGCGFEGRISEEKVINIVRRYVDSGITNISLADTAGHAYPEQVKRLFSSILELSDKINLACHFHNTYGLGMANVYTAIENGVTYIETAFGGLGGCPFTKIAAGNVCTEDFIHSLHRNNIRKDINLEKIIAVSKYASGFFVKELPGLVYKTGGLKY
ncbi:MAG: hydroxymethylglutaryl-CoA lyase [Candidatus Kapabacteria bacterium]|nr:hydroxymethylglutaryl-CoA lyase [Candidatus Kapabacteria bacterium]